ncbi:S9 family peptidase [Terriglobus saanensis]|uniref:Oligopeptidase B n=1 Tax=Terriglobus saanensis (strain ATCC BAA-1853 / DSM 23119 / SP1PR4) TaxID=401053 RepID=E8V111_TERSS|nr:oligopeptidase B [Terriglobus saanensis]ADV83359.1 Oligopeptidase B [Terriglobus saanensis SP1PR4]
MELKTVEPVARREPHPTPLHGQILEDDYFWLREKKSAEVIAYLEAENAYTAAYLGQTLPLQDKLYTEMLSHIKETDTSLPVPDGEWFYYTHTIAGKQYGVHCRKAAATDAPLHIDELAPEEVLLDVNALAEGKVFMSLGAFTMSPDASLLAYTTDTTGFRQYDLHLKNLNTGETLPDTAQRVGSVTWSADGVFLFYTVEDEQTKRQYRLYRHRVGRPQSEDVLVYEEADERFNLGVGRTRDRKYLLLEAGSHTTSEVHFLRSDDPEGEFVLIAPRVGDQEYTVDHRDGVFYLRVNDTGKNFRVVTAKVEAAGREHWTELLPHREDVVLDDFNVFQKFAVSTEKVEGLDKLRIFNFEDFEGAKLSGDAREVTFPEPSYSAGLHANRIFDTPSFRYSYQSLVSPASVFEYDVATGASTLLKQQEVPGGFDRTLYAAERVWAVAKDGVKVPVSLVYRRDSFHKDGTNPLYIYGYGSYGYPLPVGFGTNRLSLLDRGFVMAYAHIRGGGDLGDAWHDAGKMMVKKTTFTDFVDVTEHLLAEGYGDRTKVVIEGGSAGGLLMGAVVNLRPDLFQIVLSHVPFVDVMNTMLDDSLPLTVAEYEEWGNPNEAEAFAYMRSYSPYDNLEPNDYPAMLVKTSLNDSQVMYWEPAKYVAKLRTLKTNPEVPLLLHVNMDAGHGGASGRYDYLKEIAMDYAFVLTELGIGL